MKGLIGFLIVLVMCSLCIAGETLAVDASAEVAALANAERIANGVEPLVVEQGLQQSAQAHAEWMASRQRMVHSSLACYENIAMGQPSSAGVVSAWMHSRGHRANLLRATAGGALRAGVGVARAVNGSLYWCFQALGPVRSAERSVERTTTKSETTSCNADGSGCNKSTTVTKKVKRSSRRSRG
jgi:hypothetical protein